MSWFQAIGVVVLVVLAFGYANRRKKRLHITLMVTALVLDVTSVLVIEIQRGAIEEAGREFHLLSEEPAVPANVALASDLEGKGPAQPLAQSSPAPTRTGRVFSTR